MNSDAQGVAIVAAIAFLGYAGCGAARWAGSIATRPVYRRVRAHITDQMAEFSGQVREPTKKKRARVEEILVWEEEVSSDEHKQKGFTFATTAGCLGAGLLAASGYLSYQMNLRRHIKAELARKPATTPTAGSPSMTLDLPAAEVERERLRILASSQTHMRKLARSLVLSAVLSTGTFAVACGLVAWAWDLKSVRWQQHSSGRQLRCATATRCCKQRAPRR
jgi:hypothetical protein